MALINQKGMIVAVNLTLLSSTNLTNIATNFERVRTALQDVVGRSGNTPNQMNADLDLNNNDVLNVNALQAKSIWLDGEPLVPGGGGGGGGGPIPPGGLHQNLNMNGYNITNVGVLRTGQLFVNGQPVTGGGGGGGSSTLAGLDDVSILSTPEHGSALVYSSLLGKWRAAAIDSGGVVIPPGSITEDKFEEGITPVRIVDELPTENNYEGRIVFLTTDGKLYRYHNGIWVSAVPALDISGQLQDAQIASLNAVKIAGQITSTQISDNAISSPKIAAGAIIAGKIATGAIQAGNIAAGTIIGDHIQSNAITSAKIATNAVTADKIVAGAVSAAKISVSTLSAISSNIGTITAGTINGINISGTTITGGSIAGTFVNATGIQSGTTSNDAWFMDSGTGLRYTRAGGTTFRVTSVGGSGSAAERMFVQSFGGEHAIRASGRVAGSGGTGLVGVSGGGGGAAFYAEQGGYAPFTGVHDSLINKDITGYAVGDIVVSVDNVIATNGVDDALLEVDIASSVNQRGAYGIIARISEFNERDMIAAVPTPEVGEKPSEFRKALASLYNRISVNGCGEGLVAVCGRGGDISVGDYISTSDLRGKGQRQNDSTGQADDLLRRHTVAQATQSVTFSHPDEVKLIACIYKCG